MEIRIYVEGGGDHRSGKDAIREGFRKFLSTIKCSVIACGSRNATFGAFKIALSQHTTAFNILLVDAEGPVNQSPKSHLTQRDEWDLTGVSDEKCHLMVQTMEAWIIADINALREFYGANFNPNPIPASNDVEQVDKATLESALKDATRRTQKGEYHKILHGPKILGIANAQTVQGKARHCKRLIDTLSRVLNGSIS